MKRKTLLTAAALILACAGAPALADLISLNPSKDNTLFENADGTLSNGIGEHLYIGETSSAGPRRGLIAFDVAAAVPAGSTINSVSLDLFVTKVHGFNVPVRLQRSLADWGEGGSDAGDPGGGGTLANTNDATWKYRFFATSEWTTLGGDFSPTVSATRLMDSFSSITFASTAQLVADVQNMLGSPLTNYGWFIMGNEGTTVIGTANRFASVQHLDPGMRPALNIDFTAPPPPTSTYNVDANADWDSGATWTGGVPQGAGTRVVLGDIITAPRTLTVNTAHTIGSIVFDNVNAYTVQGSGGFTLSGVPAAALNVVKGSHSVAVPIFLATDTNVSVALEASTLVLSGAQTAAAGVELNKTGPGVLHVAHVRVDSLQINNGLLKVLANGGSSGTSRVKSIQFTGGLESEATLDLTDNDLVIDYDAQTPIDNVQSMISAGQLTASAATSATRLGLGEASVLGLTSFSGQTVDGTSVLVKFTYAGDANLDGQVDITDLGALATAWQTEAPWTSGDFNYSSFVDITDLGMLATNWQAGVGNPLGPSFAEALASVGLPGASVPEPSMIASALALAWSLKRPGRRRR